MRTMALLPLPVSQWIGGRFGDLIRLFDTRAAKITRANLELCLPELEPDERARLARDSLRQTGMMLMETPAAWLGRKQRLLGWIREVENFDEVDTAITCGGGVIIVLPHIGNWEMMNVFLGEHERQKDFVGLYAPPNQDWLKKLVSVARLRFGNEIVPTTIKGIATLLKRLKEGKLIVLLPDQVPTSGEFAPFFGTDTLTDIIAVRMLERCPSARVFTCTVERLPDAQGFRIRFAAAHPDLYSTDRRTALAGLNASVEACVRRLPAQYQWEYKRFKRGPPGQRRIYDFASDGPTYH
ncbi:MAG: lysophospholipid acyltransferase family protein [Gammaproteobacteria bacterium]|nr:lysophospholipid acyltransferase family protein [Gammaproteobacteria bacterium]